MSNDESKVRKYSDDVTMNLIVKRWPRNLWNLFRARAAMRNQTARDWLEELVREAVKEPKK